jgi:RNA polymerase sigma-70 factor, ECF subfamily
LRQEPRPLGALVTAVAAPTLLSDEVLVVAAGRRDPAALGLLFDRHHQLVRRFLYRLGAHAGDVDDLVHATFIEVFAAAARFRGAASVRSWLLGIACNVSRHHTRGEIRRQGLLRALAGQETSRPAEPDRSLENRQLIDRLQERLSALSHERRAAFLLCDVEECSGAEAAQALGARPGTVGRWLHEARTALRTALEEATW